MEDGGVLGHGDLLQRVTELGQVDGRCAASRVVELVTADGELRSQLDQRET